MNNTAKLQGIDYRYNIRGWLTSINNASLTADGNNEETDDAFGEELSYNNSFTAGGITGSAQGCSKNRSCYTCHCYPSNNPTCSLVN